MIDQVALEAMTDGLSAFLEGAPRRSLSDLLGARPKDFDLKSALKSQRTVDPKLWR